MNRSLIISLFFVCVCLSVWWEVCLVFNFSNVVLEIEREKLSPINEIVLFGIVSCQITGLKALLFDFTV